LEEWSARDVLAAEEGLHDAHIALFPRAEEGETADSSHVDCSLEGSTML
jgi:hypothetical protein